MQPVFTQVPPNLSRSMMATVLPAAENRAASEGPAWPVPMMMAANGFMPSERTFDTKLALFRGFFGCLSLLARDNVRGLPPRPMMLGSGRFVLSVMLLCLSQKLGQSGDVQS